MVDRPARLERIVPAATPEQTAAIVAAIERFMRATSPPPLTPAREQDGWAQAAVLEGIEREPQGDVRDPWIVSPG
jgi:hypothetical protein